MSLDKFVRFGTETNKNSENLVVEFEVEETKEHGYGLQTKYLRFRGEKVRYKAIVKHGELVAIVGRRYTVIPNMAVVERLEKILEIGEEHKALADRVTRLILNFPVKNGFSIMVTNSEDATLALSVNLLIYGVPIKKEFMEKLNVPIAYRRHIGSVSLDDLVDSIEAIKNIVEEHKEDLAKIFSITVDETVIEIVRNSKLGKKLKETAEMFKGKLMSDLFSYLGKTIWNKRIKPNVKYTYLKEIGNLLWEIVLAKNLL